ncbi:S-formylglutathione hydrolase [Sessilibacter sp. MAH2]
MSKISSFKCFDGEQLRYRHFSETLQCEMTFSIFLPPQSREGSVPVLYWLSGLTCTDENFVTKAGAQQYATDFGIAIVAPDTSPRGDDIPDDPEKAYDFGLGASFYVNATEEPWAKNYRMYDYIVRELPQLIAANFPINSDLTSISGHSMGGHGALTIALKNPEVFRSVSAFSPICSPIECPWGQKALSLYLGKDKSKWQEYDTVALVSKVEARLPVLIDQGDADNFLEEQLKTPLLIEAAEHAQFPMSIRMQPGYDHSYFFIASFIGEHIKFHAKNLL